MRTPKQFARLVRDSTAPVLIIYAYGLYTPNRDRRWPEMADPQFREEALRLLQRYPHVDQPRFSPPDSYDDWTFYAYYRPHLRPLTLWQRLTQRFKNRDS